MAEISGLSNSEVAELCKPKDPATNVSIAKIFDLLLTRGSAGIMHLLSPSLWAHNLETLERSHSRVSKSINHDEMVQ